jgi:hypothetical protein
MSTLAIRAVGFCAHYSPAGDRALEFALRLARSRSLRLNVFDFLSDPYDPTALVPEDLPVPARAALLVERERSLRLYYDERLGDYLDAGFRLCVERGWRELHRCLCKHEFQFLVLAYPDRGAVFEGVPIERFAASFVCPAALVGPGSASEIHLNQPAALLADNLGLRPDQYRVILAPEVAASSGCAPQPLDLR